MKKSVVILIFFTGFFFLSSCEEPAAQCFDPAFCPENMQKQEVEKQPRRW